MFSQPREFREKLKSEIQSYINWSKYIPGKNTERAKKYLEKIQNLSGGDEDLFLQVKNDFLQTENKDTSKKGDLGTSKNLRGRIGKLLRQYLNIDEKIFNQAEQDAQLANSLAPPIARKDEAYITFLTTKDVLQNTDKFRHSVGLKEKSRQKSFN